MFKETLLQVRCMALDLSGLQFNFISHATGFWMGVVGFLKALVWPAFLVYEAFKHFRM